MLNFYGKNQAFRMRYASSHASIDMRENMQRTHMSKIHAPMSLVKFGRLFWNIILCRTVTIALVKSHNT